MHITPYLVHIYCPLLQYLISKLAMVLILEHACLSFASQSKPTKDEALDEAYSRYCASSVHNELTKQFSAPPEEYSIPQFTEFIHKYRL